MTTLLMTWSKHPSHTAAVLHQFAYGLQSARYLLKNLLGSQTGRAPQGSAAYLGNAKAEMKSKCEVSKAKQWREPGVQLAALRYCSVPFNYVISQYCLRSFIKSIADTECWDMKQIV